MTFNISRVLCGLAMLMFIVAAAGSAFGMTATSREVVALWGAAVFAAGHTF